MTPLYVEYINQTILDGELITLTSTKYSNGMRDLVQIKGRVPLAKARFCTEALKIEPMKACLETIDEETTVYDGIRAAESEARRLKPAREWAEHYDSWLEHLLLTWPVEDVFAMMAKHDIKPTPLYLLGAHTALDASPASSSTNGS